MRVKIKTKEEFGYELPIHWVDAMEYLCGTEVEVKPSKFDEDEWFVQNDTYGWQLLSSDFIVLENVDNETN